MRCTGLEGIYYFPFFFFFNQAWCLEVPAMSNEVLDLISKGLKLMILSMVGFYCSSGGLKTSATL